MTRRIVLVAVVPVLALPAGCGGSSGGSSSGGAPAASGSGGAGHGASHAERYVALGDSYTSAPLTGRDVGPHGCEQSADNYPHLVARRLGLDLHDVSCAGAETTSLTGPQRMGTFAVPPQLDAVTPSTRIVTLSVGANDQAAFSELIELCGRLSQSDPHGTPCTDAVHGGTKMLAGYRAATTSRLVGVVRTIRRRAPHARVLVVGYPQVLPASGDCPELPIATGDIPFARRANEAFNDAMRAAVRRTGVEYVDTWRITRGHDICGAKPWIAGVHPQGSAAPFHPYAVEQSAVARVVVRVLRHQA